MPKLIKSFISEEIQMNTLEKYVRQIINYSNKFNLIGKSTIIDIWDRHILDSAQIFQLLPNNKNCPEFNLMGNYHTDITKN